MVNDQLHRKYVGKARLRSQGLLQEKSARALKLTLTFPRNCQFLPAQPLCGRKEELKQQQQKSERKPEKKAGAGRGGRSICRRNIAYMIFKAWNLLTSRGVHVSCLFSQ